MSNVRPLEINVAQRNAYNRNNKSSHSRIFAHHDAEHNAPRKDAPGELSVLTDAAQPTANASHPWYTNAGGVGSISLVKASAGRKQEIP